MPLSIAFTVAQAELVCHKVALMYIRVPVFSSWVYQGHLSLTNIFLLLFFTLTQDLKHPWMNFIVDASCDVVCGSYIIGGPSHFCVLMWVGMFLVGCFVCVDIQ